MVTTKTISEVMTPCPHSVGIDQPVTIARQLMRQYNIRHLPVQEGGKLVGVISDRDINFAVAMNEKLNISDIYTPEPYIVTPETKLEVVVSEMAKEKFGCALVVKNEKLVGVFTTVDACKVLAGILKS